MHNGYANVITRFLRPDERLMSSAENEMPLVIEADSAADLHFLQNFLTLHSTQLKEDIAKYGAVLLRGFAVTADEDFENTVLSIQGMQGISEAFMSEQGRIHVGELKFVLHTNAVYKTGGTLYLGGFHSENYYSTDVPAYISFCCLEPSALGGETGLVNAEKVFANLDPALQQKLEKNNFFVAKWLVNDVAKRYQITPASVEKICKHFDLPVIGKGDDKFILMYKPNVFLHPLTQQKALQINLFEILPLNAEMRKCFMNDYQGNTWFWHRFVWRLPASVLKAVESVYIAFASLFYSPKESWQILKSKFAVLIAAKKKNNLPDFNALRVGSCFNDAEVKQLARLIRKYYSSCLWEQGDILLVDNLKVLHAGMPGRGPRRIRAMICNPVAMSYSNTGPGYLHCQNRKTESIGFYMSRGKLPQAVSEPELCD